MQTGTSKRLPGEQQQAVGSGGSSGRRQRFMSGQRSSSSTISEASLPTPSPTNTQSQGQIRCVCNRPEVEVDGAVFLVKWYVSPRSIYPPHIILVCKATFSRVSSNRPNQLTSLNPCSDSCEYLLHGRCVDLHAVQDVPHVYICAFCANAPMRGGRLRYASRSDSTAGLGNGGDDGGLMGPPVSATGSLSPLAHKSFRSFR